MKCQTLFSVNILIIIKRRVSSATILRSAFGFNSAN